MSIIAFTPVAALDQQLWGQRHHHYQDQCWSPRYRRRHHRLLHRGPHKRRPRGRPADPRHARGASWSSPAFPGRRPCSRSGSSLSTRCRWSIVTCLGRTRRSRTFGSGVRRTARCSWRTCTVRAGCWAGFGQAFAHWGPKRRPGTGVARRSAGPRTTPGPQRGAAPSPWRSRRPPPRAALCRSRGDRCRQWLRRPSPAAQ
mmetsp:Transcript_31974/g.88067  ORF Transcript_31974/g.88067 Transcript_31974/m.88067 type:complete len:200 (+) Transcript_31974:637-1236(+)